MEIKIKKTIEINSIEEWFAIAPPKDSKKQWKDGRSAKELARFATNPSFKVFIQKVLREANIDEQDFVCEPEATTSFGKGWGKGGPRNHDLLMIGEDTLIGLEAKVSESYGITIEKEKSKVKDKTRVKKCLEFFYETDEGKDNMYYQLLTAIIGTIKAAQKQEKIKNVIVLFLILKGDVEKEKSYDKKVAANNEAFKVFCNSLNINDDGRLEDGKNGINGINCWIIKEEVEIIKKSSYIIL